MIKVLFSSKSVKEIGRISSVDRNRVLAKIELLNYPFPKHLDVKSLRGTPCFFRLRVGQVRVIFDYEVKTGVVWIRKIGYRGSVYMR